MTGLFSKQKGNKDRLNIRKNTKKNSLNSKEGNQMMFTYWGETKESTYVKHKADELIPCVLQLTNNLAGSQ